MQFYHTKKETKQTVLSTFGKWRYPKRCTMLQSFDHSHTLMVEVALQGAKLPIRSNWEFSILLKDTLALSRGSGDRTSDPLVCGRLMSVCEPEIRIAEQTFESRHENPLRVKCCRHHLECV